jgi:DNA-directed RNA polymerase specialized sigma24 family protein
MPPTAQQCQAAYSRAFALALSIVRNQHDAEDVAQEALSRAIDPDRSPWRPEVQPNFTYHVVNVAREVLKERRAKWKVRTNPRNASAEAEALRTPPLRADALVAARDGHERDSARRAGMRVQLAGLELRVFELYERDITNPAEQANLLKATIKDIYEARRRVAEVARSIPADLESGPALAVNDGEEEDEEGEEAPS